MADFDEVLRKTIEGLKNQSPQMRQRVYAKARETIALKLDVLRPPPPPHIVDRQLDSLERAIKRVENSYATQLSEALRTNVRRFLSGRPEVVEKRLSDPIIEYWLSSLGTQLWSPDEPLVAGGPDFVLKGPKLSLAKVPPENAVDQVQAALHGRLRTQITRFRGSIAKLENRFPDLVSTTKLYADLLEPDTPDLDLVGIWSIGSVLMSLEHAYRVYEPDTSFTAALEPTDQAALAAISRMHGAFMMGFQETRDLVLRADEFAREVVTEEVARAGDTLIEGLVDPRIVDDETLRLNTPIRNFVHAAGWTSTRVGFSAYLTVRNGLIAMMRLVVGNNPSALELMGGAAIIAEVAGLSTSQFLNVAVPWLQQNSGAVLSFFSHSPEARAYAEYVLALVDDNEK